MITRSGVLTALLCLLRRATVLVDNMSLQNVGIQHTKSTRKTGIFTLNTFEDYLLSVNWLTFERLFIWTQVWHTIPTAISVLDQLTWSLPHSSTLSDADVSRPASCQSPYCRRPDMSVSQLPVAVLSVAWHVSWPADSCCTVSRLTCQPARCQSLCSKQLGESSPVLNSNTRWLSMQ